MTEFIDYEAGQQGIARATEAHPILRPLLALDALRTRNGLVRVRRVEALAELRERQLLSASNNEWAQTPGGTSGTWLWVLVGGNWHQVGSPQRWSSIVGEALDRVTGSVTAVVFITAINACFGEHAVSFGGQLIDTPDLYNIEIWEPLN